jgi:hypothetical protein
LACGSYTCQGPSRCSHVGREGAFRACLFLRLVILSCFGELSRAATSRNRSSCQAYSMPKNCDCFPSLLGLSRSSSQLFLQQVLAHHRASTTRWLVSARSICLLSAVMLPPPSLWFHLVRHAITETTTMSLLDPELSITMNTI